MKTLDECLRHRCPWYTSFLFLLDNMARKTQTTFTRALGYAAVVSHALAETCSGAIFVWNLTLGRYFELTASFFFIYMVL